jgi:hypothetical protein
MVQRSQLAHVHDEKSSLIVFIVVAGGRATTVLPLLRSAAHATHQGARIVLSVLPQDNALLWRVFPGSIGEKL